MLNLIKNLLPTSVSEDKTKEIEGKVDLAGSLTRQQEVDAPLDSTNPANTMSSHVSNIGKQVEDMEIKMRNLLGEVYFSSENTPRPLLSF
jgi:capping protein (actin filament) muscle Z-line, beta